MAQRPLRIVIYAVATLDGWSEETHYGTLQALRQTGLPVPRCYWLCSDMQAALKRAEECRNLAETLPYDIDGAVIKLNRLADWHRLGATAHHPQYAIAYKPRHWLQQAQTRLRAITIQVGRTGILTPVAELEPVFLAGSTISRATLHNADDIRRKDIRIGDTVVIERAGMVIPAVVNPMPEKRSGTEKPFAMPASCPACNGPVNRRTDSRGDKTEAAWRCENLQCPAQKTRRLEHFASRAALDITGLGGIVADALVEKGMVNEPLDLFELDREKLAALNLGTAENPRTFGAKNAAKLTDAMDRTLSLPLERWLFALAIPNVGAVTARRLAALHPTLEAVAASPIVADIIARQDTEEAIKSARQGQRSGRKSGEDKGPDKTLERLNARLGELKQRLAQWDLTDLGPVAAKSVSDFFRSPAGRLILTRCQKLGIDPRSEGIAKDKKSVRAGINGKTFVLTGTLPQMSRSEAAERIRAGGGAVTATVSRKTDYLVTGADTGAAKLQQAGRLGVPLLSENEFMALLGDGERPIVKRQPRRTVPVQDQLEF